MFTAIFNGAEKGLFVTKCHSVTQVPRLWLRNFKDLGHRATEYRLVYLLQYCFTDETKSQWFSSIGRALRTLPVNWLLQRYRPLDVKTDSGGISRLSAFRGK